MAIRNERTYSILVGYGIYLPVTWRNIVNVRLVQFNLGAGQRSAAQAIANKIVPEIRAQQGCERCEFFADDSTGDYGLVVLWESHQAADAAAMLITPILMPALAGAKGS